MTMKLNRPAYDKLVEEDLEWLEKQPRTLERPHQSDREGICGPRVQRVASEELGTYVGGNQRSASTSP